MPNIPYVKNNTAYRYKPTINEDRLPTLALPIGWEQSACREFSGLTKHFYGGGSIRYDYRENLIRSFGFFYAVLTDRVTLEGVEITPEFKQVIKEKIKEDIDNCSQGFHNRINSLYGLFFVPKTIDALLQSIRQSIIINAITKVTQDVHRQNGILEQASQLGYGIACANNKDDYGRGALSVVEANAVHNAFQEKFTWVHILAGLKDEIKAVLNSSYGYHGRLSDVECYDKGDYDSFRNYVNELFDKNINEQDFFIFDDDYKVIDINWQTVSTELWHTVKKELFNFPTGLLNSLETLFTIEQSDEPSQQQLKKDLSNIRTYLTNKGEILSLMCLFPQIDKRLMIDELFNLSSLSNGRQIREDLDYFVRNCALTSEERIYAIAKFKEKYPSYYHDLKKSLCDGYKTHKLLDQYRKLDKEINTTFFSLGLLLPEDRLEILNQRLSDGKTLLGSILTHHYVNNYRHLRIQVEINKQRAFSQKKTSFISLIDDFSSEQLSRFFEAESYVVLALEHDRQSLVPLLTKLEKCDENTIANQLVSLLEMNKVEGDFFALLNRDNVLTEKISEDDNKPLNKDELEKVQKLAIALFSKLPADFKNSLIPCSRDNNFLMTYSSLGLVAEVGKVLFDHLDKNLISSLVATLPDEFEGKHIERLISLMEVAPVSLLMPIFKKHIRYAEALPLFSHTCPLVRKLFFDKDAFPVLLKVFKSADLQQQTNIVELIFNSKDTNELAVFLEKNNADVTYKEFKIFSSLLPREIQCKQMEKAWAASTKNWSKMIPFMHDFTKEEVIVFFKIRVSFFLKLKYGHFKQAVNNDSEHHQSLALYLKAVELEEDRNWIINSLFSKNPAIFSKMLSCESSRELLNLFPSKLIFSMFEHVVRNDLMTKESYAKCVDFLPTLKKGKKLKDLEMKSRMERDVEKRQRLKQLIESETQIDHANNIKEARFLSQLLLLLAPNRKTVFQNILEMAPSKAFQLLHWADFFERENICQSYISRACKSAFDFDFESIASNKDSFNDLLKIVEHAPPSFLLKNLSSVSLSVSDVQSMQNFFDVAEKMNNSSIQHLFEKKRATAQSEKTFLEQLISKTENALLMIESAFGFIKKLKVEKGIIFKNVMDLNNCPEYFNLEVEQQINIFQTVWNDDLCDRERLLDFLKAIDVNNFVKLKFLLLNFAAEVLEVQDVDYLISYGAENKGSLLKEAVMAHECMNEFNWQQVLNQLSQKVIFGLLGSEYYDSQRRNLVQYLLQKKQYQSFFKIYEFVSECKKSELKDNFLKGEMSFPSDFKLIDLLSHPDMHAGVAAFYLSKKLPVFLGQIKNVVFGLGLETNTVDIFCQQLIATEQGKKYFSDLIAYTDVEFVRPLFVRLVRSKHDGLFEKAFAGLDLLAPSQKLELMRKLKGEFYDFYKEVSEKLKPYYFPVANFSLEQKRIIKHHLSLLPYENWQEFGAQHAFFFDEYHLDKENLISPYLFGLEPKDFRILLGRIEKGNKTFIKVFDELEQHSSYSQSDFLRLLADKKVESYRVEHMLNFTCRDGCSFAAHYVANDSADLTLFVTCLETIDVIRRHQLLSNYIYELKALKPGAKLLPYLELKLELLSLEKIRHEAGARCYSSTNRSCSELYDVLVELTATLNDAYKIAISSDSSDSDKAQSIEAVKLRICDPKTRDLINTHRGVKKIVLNILLAFAGLGVGYLVGCLVNYHLTEGKHFFYHPPTRTETAVMDIAHRVQSINVASRGG